VNREKGKSNSPVAFGRDKSKNKRKRKEERKKDRRKERRGSEGVMDNRLNLTEQIRTKTQHTWSISPQSYLRLQIISTPIHPTEKYSANREPTSIHGLLDTRAQKT